MFESLATVVCGLGLFFAGVWFLTDNLKKLAGDRLCEVLAASTGRPWRGFSIGLLIGGLTHTATIAVFILVCLLAARLTTVRAAVPILLGVNVGTSALVFLATLNFQLVALLVTGIAGIVLASDKAAGWRPVASVVFGVGLLFVGIGMLADSATAMAHQSWAQGLLSANPGSLLGAFAVGVVLRIVAQSGSAVSILAISLSGSGLFGIEQTIMAIYGANFGAAISTWILSLGVRAYPGGIALYQVLFDVLGGVILVPALYVEMYTDVPLVQALVTLLADDVQRQMAYVYLLFNVTAAGALVAAMSARSCVTRWRPRPQCDDDLATRRMPGIVEFIPTLRSGTGPVSLAVHAPVHNRVQTWSVAMAAIASIALALGINQLPDSRAASRLAAATLDSHDAVPDGVTTRSPRRQLSSSNVQDTVIARGAISPRRLASPPQSAPADDAGAAALATAQVREAVRLRANSRAEMDALIARAHADIAALRLTRPRGNSAWDRFTEVLHRDPVNAQARQGLIRIVARYHEMAEYAQAAGNARRADVYLHRARTVLSARRDCAEPGPPASSAGALRDCQ